MMDIDDKDFDDIDEPKERDRRDRDYERPRNRATVARKDVDEAKKFMLVWGGIFAFLVIIGSGMMYFVNIAEKKELMKQMHSEQQRQEYTRSARRRLAERKQSNLQSELARSGKR